MLKNPSKVSEGFTAEILQTGKECDDMFKVLKFKKLPTKNTLPCKAVLQNERDTAFLSPKKLSDFITTTTWHNLQERLKGLQAEMKGY